MKYSAAQVFFGGKYLVPQEYHEANYEKFQAKYPGYYVTPTGSQVKCEAIDAFHICYLRQGNPCYGDQLDGNSGPSPKKHSEESRQGSKKRRKLGFSGSDPMGPDKQREAESQLDLADGSGQGDSNTDSGEGDTVG